MLHGREVVDMLVAAVFTQTDLAAVAEILDRNDAVQVTGDKLPCLVKIGGSSHHLIPSLKDICQTERTYFQTHCLQIFVSYVWIIN
jgi:hypothetical protein